MRILPNWKRKQILGWIENSFLNLTINPFLFDTTQAIIASGEEEATFDWLAVNYIWNTLVNDDEDLTTFGALDLGGQSTYVFHFGFYCLLLIILCMFYLYIDKSHSQQIHPEIF